MFTGFQIFCGVMVVVCLFTAPLVIRFIPR